MRYYALSLVLLLYFKFTTLTDAQCISIDKCQNCSTGACTLCVLGNYLSNNNTECTNCGSEYNCTLCNQTLTTYPYFSQCVDCSQCSNQCLDPACKICSTTQCFSCAIHYYLNSNYQCNACDSSCLTCSGSSSNNCLTCVDGYYLSNNTCLSCSLTCKTCNSSVTCLSCNSNGTLDTNNTCNYLCDSSCQTCYGTQTTNCLSCNQNTILYENQCIIPGCSENCGYCVTNVTVNVSLISSICKSCKLGYFLSPSCLACSSTCQTCNGLTENDCLSCNNGFYLNKNTNTCDACYFSCFQCYGPQLGSCSSCIEGYFQLESACHPCNETCKTCFGPNNNHCLSCTSMRIFQTNTSQCILNSSTIDNNNNSGSNDGDSINKNALIISLSVIFGVLFVAVIVLTICYIKAKKTVKELKYIQNEILSRNSVKFQSEQHSSHAGSINNLPENKKSGMITPLEHHELIKNDNFENILDNNCKDIEKIYEN